VIAFPIALVAANFAIGRLPYELGSVGVGIVQSDSSEMSELRALSHDAGGRGAKLVVWPEFSGLLLARNGDTSKLQRLALESGMPAFVTSFRDGFEPLPHNTAAVFSRQGESSPYFKRKLYGSESQMHSPGSNAVAVPSQVGIVGLNICFDSCYPAIIRDTARLNADMIAVPTIDPESPYDFFAANHAAFMPIRAAENGVSIIRADGGAYSMIVDPNGRIVGQLECEKNKTAVGRIPNHGHWTLYKWAGDWFLYLCAAVPVWALLTRRKPAASPIESA